MPRKEQVQAMFDAIARRYDLLNHLLSCGVDRRWRARAVRLLGDAPGRVLDIACGTGDLSLASARRGARVVGVDISENMLEIARAKLLDRGLSDRVTFQCGDAESLAFPDASFDAVTIAFGARNFEHLDRALREILRVLRPGGRLIILEFSTPTAPFVAGLYRFYFTRVLPFLGGLLSGDRAAYAYLPSSVLAFPSGARFLSILDSSGFTSASARPLTFGIATLYTAIAPLPV
ncbi:MAG: bifunctional demethylmenaquinone methyltransferase/2-methoxy-6-polyprenyl-1,4-benzoquinol methylase UbiE [Odoribacteraceae bacterium]|jgi:demethylmenaquinone methyltransferase/2-methoxy-6-polyprenyl-1,4-benzoquinol methylase|nr:bifunctional demethylmenaquinone methyltransferase/2-methoxy-6-polyprenyl-1,4-benzoquinol methylase UbiE [Odoribacteraceae bacterium]